MPCVNVHQSPESPETKGVGKFAAQVGFYAQSIYVSSSVVHRKNPSRDGNRAFPSWELTRLCSDPSRPRAASVPRSRLWELASAQLGFVLSSPNIKHMHVNQGICERAGNSTATLAAASSVSKSFSCRKAASSPAPKLPGTQGWRGRDPVPAQGGPAQHHLLLCFSSLPYKVHPIFV